MSNEEALNEIELTQPRTTASRCEEDQTPLVKYSLGSSTLHDSDQKYCGLCGPKACIIILLVMLASVALATGLAAGLNEKHKHKHSIDENPNTKEYNGTLTYLRDRSPYHNNDSCGPTYTNNDYFVVISYRVFDTNLTAENSTVSPYCGHQLRAMTNGHSLNLTVNDVCMNEIECEINDLVVDYKAYDLMVPDENENFASVTWHWLPPYAST